MNSGTLSGDLIMVVSVYYNAILKISVLIEFKAFSAFREGMFTRGKMPLAGWEKRFIVVDSKACSHNFLLKKTLLF